MTDVMSPAAPKSDPTTTPVKGAFHSVLVIEGERTTDSREFALGSLSWRTLPLPLMWQQSTDTGHKGAVVVGKITAIERRGNELHGWGTFDLGGDNGREAFRLVSEQIMRGVSIDAELLEIDKEKLVGEDGDEPTLYILEARIGAVTMVAFPAFPQAVIALDGAEIPPATSAGRGESLPNTDTYIISNKLWDTSFSRFTDDQLIRASAGCRTPDSPSRDDHFLPHHEPDGSLSRSGLQHAASRFNLISAPASSLSIARFHLEAHYTSDLREPIPDLLHATALLSHAEKPGPPASWFDDPELKDLTPFTVARNGRVYGHIGGWNQCHIGYKECMRPPRSRTNYANYRVGSVFASGCDCEDGIPTGVITLGTTHADPFSPPDAARRHYDNSGYAVADVACGEDAYGIWIAGSLRPGVTDAQLRALRGSALSGDWRSIGGGMELINILAVNVPGFPIPRVTAGIEGGVQVSLVAAGMSEELPADDETGSGLDPSDILDELKRDTKEKGNGEGDKPDPDPTPDPNPDDPDTTPDPAPTP